MIPFYCCKWCDWCDFRSCSFVQNVSNMQRQKETHRDSSIKMNQCWLKFSFVSGLWLWLWLWLCTDSLRHRFQSDTCSFNETILPNWASFSWQTRCFITFNELHSSALAHILVFWYAQTFWHVSKQQLFASMQKRVPDKISIKINELRRVFHRMSYFMNENFATK